MKRFVRKRKNYTSSNQITRISFEKPGFVYVGDSSKFHTFSLLHGRRLQPETAEGLVRQSAWEVKGFFRRLRFGSCRTSLFCWPTSSRLTPIDSGIMPKQCLLFPRFAALTSKWAMRYYRALFGVDALAKPYNCCAIVEWRQQQVRFAGDRHRCRSAHCRAWASSC